MKSEKNHIKRCLQLLLFSVFFLSGIKAAHSLGIMPAEQVFEYIPGNIENCQVTIQNSLPYEIDVELFARGVLSSSVTFTQGDHVTVPAKQKASVPITIKLPEEDTVYGKACAIVWAKRVPKTNSGISATEKVGAKFCTEIPYPGKYLELSVSPKAVNVGTSSSTVLLKYTSKGKEIIQSIKSTIYILNKNGTVLKQYQTKEVKDLFTGAQETIALEIDVSDLLGGEYIVKVDTIYDEKTISKNATLTIGYPDIEVRSYSNNIAVNFADEFKISLKNKYLNDFKVVYAEIVIYSDGKELSYSTAPITLKADSYGNLKTVIPTQNLKVGEYPIRIIIHFDDKTKEINGKLLVTEKTEPKKTQMQTPNPGFNLNTVITFVVLANGLIIVLLVVVITRNRKIKEGEL